MTYRKIKHNGYYYSLTNLAKQLGEMAIRRMSKTAQEYNYGTDSITVYEKADALSDNLIYIVSFDFEQTFKVYSFNELQQELETLQAELDGTDL